MRHTAHNFRQVDNPHTMRHGGVFGCGEHYTTISTPASGMPTNREAHAVYNATVKPRVTFALISKSSKGEQIAAGVAATNTLGREPIAGGEIGKSGNIQKHREVYRENTWDCWREAADESRMSGEVVVRGHTSFSFETANHARTVADEVRYFNFARFLRCPNRPEARIKSIVFSACGSASKPMVANAVTCVTAGETASFLEAAR